VNRSSAARFVRHFCCAEKKEEEWTAALSFFFMQGKARGAFMIHPLPTWVPDKKKHKFWWCLF